MIGLNLDIVLLVLTPSMLALAWFVYRAPT